MMPADDATYDIPSPTDLECESCSWTNTADVWDDIRTGAWQYSFECASCGHLNKASGTSLDRGGIAPFLSLLVLGVLLVALPLGSLFFMRGTLTHHLLILTGALLLGGLFALAFIAWCQRTTNGTDHS